VKNSQRKVYVHTLRGRPMAFTGQCLTHMNPYNRLPGAASLRQIRSEQAKDMHFRAKLDLSLDESSDYGYVIVWLPKGDSK
jgi:hypothetical protein